MLTMRIMQMQDIPFGLQLCRLAGWNQVEPDWRRLLHLAPDGVFVAEQDGQPCGTGSTTRYGSRIGWIGMILVHPDFRKRGIGTAIMDKCIAHLRSQNVESIKLDATDLGRPVYLKLDFEDERPIHRYRGTKPRDVGADSRVRPIEQADWPAIAELDRVAFDADRVELLRIFANDGPAVIFQSPANPCRGYGVARKGFHASFLGPVVATDAEAARAVVAALLGQLPDGEIFWDVLPDNAACKELAESLGFTVARRLIRMYLGQHIHPGDVNLVFGAAGFELG